MAVKMARVGAFVEMSYRMLPEIRGSFTPDFKELGFDFQEVRQITHNTELRFQIFPNDMLAPLKKRLEDVRSVLKSLDEGPFGHLSHPFLCHESVRSFRLLANTTRAEIEQELKRSMLDNYKKLRMEAYEELKATFAALLPGIGVENAEDVLADTSWFDQVFPPQSALRGDVRLEVSIHNVHPMALMEDATLFHYVATFLERPRQLSLFRS